MSGRMGNFLRRMEYKYGRYAVHNLMMYIVIGMGFVYLTDLLFPYNLASYISFDLSAIASGQIWRIVSFIFIPPSASMIFIFFALYFYWLLGLSLENRWGAFKFNIFYLTGMTGTVLAGLLTGFAANYYLNMSLFFAFALIYPDFELRLFFLIPIKVKYLAILNAVFFLYALVTAGFTEKIAILVSLANVFLFFGNDFLGLIKGMYRKMKWKQNFRR